MIPKINLDDRTFDDIFNDALKLIPRYCPEWTNHNTSDPGITLLELFSWMTEMTIYRLNKVPEKTYLSLLELMGLSLITPQSSRAVVQFFPVDGIKKNIEIKAGTQIAASVSNEADIIFETEKRIVINNNELLSCVNKYKESVKENIQNREIQEFNLFESKTNVEHAFYICSESFKYLSLDNYVRIELEPSSDIIKESDQFIRHVFWEYWDGEKWSSLETSTSINKSREKDNVLYLHGNINIQSLEINKTEGFWIRAVLSDVPEKESILHLKSVKLKTIFGGNGFLPDMCLKGNNGQYSSTDMNTSFQMFSDTPQFNETFYVSADEILKNKNVKVEFIYYFAEHNAKVEDNNNAQFIYEYWNGTDWKKIEKENNFTDGTFNLKQSGVVSFIIPSDITEVSVNNEVHYWIRIRLVTKDYSIGGTYQKDEKDNWIWKFSSKVQNPKIDKIRIKYETKIVYPLDCLTYSNFSWKQLKDFTKKQNNKDVKIFLLDENEFPSMYLGFKEKFPEGEYSLYFRINEENTSIKNNTLNLLSENKFKSKSGKRYTCLLWEYYNGEKWKELSVNDSTDIFHQSGYVSFNVPEDSILAENFGKKLFWYRVSLISGSFENTPVIENILINTVYVKNEKTYENEVIGSGTGAPGQTYRLAHPNILKGSELYVNEGTIPSTNELNIIREDCNTEPFYRENDNIWVRYTEVENFYTSNAFSRHYVVDYSTGQILFGDGVKGINPPKGKFNIMMKHYHTGGGAVGNVTKNTISGLLKGIPFISGCTNPYPAEGGSDMERIDSLKARAAGSFKSLHRAVTTEDYEWIALEASSSVARAHCLKNRTSKNEVCTIVVPVRSEGFGYENKLIPSRELLRRIKEYLDERKIVGTPICVRGPVYKEFNISLGLTLKSSVYDDAKVSQQIEKMLRIFYDSIEGDEGNGWIFGKEVTSGSVLKKLENVDEILSINNVEIFDLDANVAVEKILLKEDQLPFLRKVIINKM